MNLRGNEKRVWSIKLSFVFVFVFFLSCSSQKKRENGKILGLFIWFLPLFFVSNNSFSVVKKNNNRAMENEE